MCVISKSTGVLFGLDLMPLSQSSSAASQRDTEVQGAVQVKDEPCSRMHSPLCAKGR